MASLCEHQRGTGVYRYTYSPSLLHHPLTRWPSLTFWDMMEDRYEDVAADEVLWVTQIRDRIADKELVTDYFSKKVDCAGGIHRGCWIRYIVHYLAGEECPMKWNIHVIQKTNQ